jgi:hypothetical protein
MDKVKKAPLSPEACRRLVAETLAAHGLNYKLEVFQSPDFGSVFVTICDWNPEHHDMFREIYDLGRANGFSVARG